MISFSTQVDVLFFCGQWILSSKAHLLGEFPSPSREWSAPKLALFQQQHFPKFALLGSPRRHCFLLGQPFERIVLQSLGVSKTEVSWRVSLVLTMGQHSAINMRGISNMSKHQPTSRIEIYSKVIRDLPQSCPCFTSHCSPTSCHT